MTREETQRRLLYALLVFALALAARLVYLGTIEASPYFDPTRETGADTHRFFVWALSISEQGRLLGEGVFNQAPLYPYFLALCFKLAGGGNLILPRLVQMVMGSFTAVLVFLLGARVRGDRVGLFAGLLAAAYGHLIFYDGAFLREGLENFTFMLLLLLMMTARERPGWWRGAAAGAAFGLALLAKPTIEIMIPAGLVWVWEARRAEVEAKRASLPRGGSWKALAAGAAVGFMLIMSPLWARNHAVGVPVFSLTSRGPLEFIAGNHPEASTYGWNITPHILELNREAHGSMARAVVLALKLYRHQPLALVRRELYKAWQLFDGFEIPKELNMYIESRYVPLFRLPWVNWPVLLALALPGLVIAWPQRRRFLELYAFVILYSLGLVAFYVISSFRLALVPALCVFAGAALDELIRRLARRERRGAALIMVPALVLAVLFWPRPEEPIGINEYHNLVRRHLILNQPAQARAWCDEGLAEARKRVKDKGDAVSHYMLARMLFLEGAPLEEVDKELDRADRADKADKAPPWLPFLLEEARGAVERRRREGDPKFQGYRL